MAAAVARAGENIEASFEPVVESVRDFDRLVPRGIRRQRAVVRPFRSPGGKVVMQLDHRHAARDGFRTVNLDFVVFLSAGQRSDQADRREDESGSECDSGFQRGCLGKLIRNGPRILQQI